MTRVRGVAVFICAALLITTLQRLQQWTSNQREDDRREDSMAMPQLADTKPKPNNMAKNSDDEPAIDVKLPEIKSADIDNMQRVMEDSDVNVNNVHLTTTLLLLFILSV